MGGVAVPVTALPPLCSVNNVCKDPNPIDWLPPGWVSIAEKHFSLLWLQSVKQSQSLYLVEKEKSWGKSELWGRRCLGGVSGLFVHHPTQFQALTSVLQQELVESSVGNKPLIQLLQISDFGNLLFFFLLLKKKPLKFGVVLMLRDIQHHGYFMSFVILLLFPFTANSSTKQCVFGC